MHCAGERILITYVIQLGENYQERANTLMNEYSGFALSFKHGGLELKSHYNHFQSVYLHVLWHQPLETILFNLIGQSKWTRLLNKAS